MTIHGLSRIDQICDCIPVLSTANNVIDLYMKIVVLPRQQPATIKASHYYSYLNAKTFTRSILLLIPILGQIVVYLGDRLFDDKIFALEQVKKNGLNLQHISKRLQNNKEVVLAAALNNPAALIYASEKLRNSKSFASELMRARKDDLVLKHMGPRPQNSKTVLLVAIELNGLALQWAGDVPRKSPKVVRAAVLKNFYAVMYADRSLQNNKPFVIELIALEPRIGQFLSKELQNDIDVKQALDKASSISLTQWDDEGFVLEKVKENPFLFKRASNRLKGNKEFVLRMIKVHIESVLEARRNGSLSTRIKAWIFSNSISRTLQEDGEVKRAIQASERAIQEAELAVNYSDQ